MHSGYMVYTETTGNHGTCLGIVKSCSLISHYQPRASTCPGTTVNRTPALCSITTCGGSIKHAVSSMSKRVTGGSASNGFVGRRFTLHATSVVRAPKTVFGRKMEI